MAKLFIRRICLFLLILLLGVPCVIIALKFPQFTQEYFGMFLFFGFLFILTKSLYNSIFDVPSQQKIKITQILAPSQKNHELMKLAMTDFAHGKEELYNHLEKDRRWAVNKLYRLHLRICTDTLPIPKKMFLKFYELLDLNSGEWVFNKKISDFPLYLPIETFLDKRAFGIYVDNFKDGFDKVNRSLIEYFENKTSDVRISRVVYTFC